MTLKRFVRLDERHVELRPESANPVHEVMKLDLAKHILDIDGVAVGALIGELRDMARACAADRRCWTGLEDRVIRERG